MTIQWNDYNVRQAQDELIDEHNQPRTVAKRLIHHLASFSDEELDTARTAAELAIKLMGITFTVYHESGGAIDRAWPFDIIPRIMSNTEWQMIEAGLKQRVHALNLFISDIYSKQQIIKDRVFPAELIANSENFRPQCMDITPPLNCWSPICGSDLVRDQQGTMYVLEDNLRVPSGVSYMLENRSVMKRVFPDFFEDYTILPVDDYPSQLFATLAALSPRPTDNPTVVVLTPGIYNSAYFEHAYLAQQMGCELVEGRDLIVENDNVYMLTIEGPEQVDVIYRRIDDLFLDPKVFNPDSLLGVPGLMQAWAKGNVALANAPGAGVADDKVVYAFVPKMIKYYLNEEMLLPNVPTYLCFDPKERDFVLNNLDKLVVKPANASGGYGMLIGPIASKKQRKQFAEFIKENPRNYIAQPTLALSTVPTLINHHIEPRHVDMRPFILSGHTTQVTMGGLTRVAMVPGSLVVNSSQGGGSKDTWIVDEEACLTC